MTEPANPVLALEDREQELLDAEARLLGELEAVRAELERVQGALAVLTLGR